MNRADVALLDNQLNELGNTFLRNRQLAQEGALRSKEIDVNQAFRNAQMEHYAQMQQAQEDRADQANQRNDLLEKQIGLKQSAQDLSEAQASLKESVGTLAGQVKAGKMTQEQATQYFRDSMDNGIGKQNPQLHDQMLAQPQYKAMYDGQMDWATVADQLAAQGRGAGAGAMAGKTDLQVQHWRQAQQAAEKSGDPDDQKYADTLYANLPASIKSTGPADYTQTSIKPGPFGGPPTTNTVSRTYSRPAPVVPGAAGTAAPSVLQIPLAPPDPTQRVAGQHYTTPKGVFMWDGQQWQTPGSAQPTQAVPGFGSAQPGANP